MEDDEAIDIWNDDDFYDPEDDDVILGDIQEENLGVYY